MASEVQDAAAEVQRRLDIFVLRHNLLPNETTRRESATRMLAALRRAANDITGLLNQFRNRTIMIIVGGVPRMITLDAAFINQNSVITTSFFRQVAEAAETGSALPVGDAPVVAWISAILLAVLAAVALFFSAPAVALILAIGAAIAVVIASLSNLTEDAGRLLDSSGPSVVMLGLIAVAIIYLAPKLVKELKFE